MTIRSRNIAFALLLTAGLIQFHFAYSALAQSNAPETAIDPGTSRNWAGYVADSSTYTAVAGSWIVPTPSQDQDGANATWVGIGGVRARDLIQTGTQALVEDGRIEYSAWYELLPGLQRKIAMDISGGDSVSASIAETSPGVWHIHLRNDTNGETFDKDVEYDSSYSSAEWIEELPTGVGFSLDLSAFGSTSFKNGTATTQGATVSIAGAGARPLQMANRNDEVTASVSSLGTDGSSFTVTRTNATSGAVSAYDPMNFEPTDEYYTRYALRYRIYIVQGEDGFHIYVVH